MAKISIPRYTLRDELFNAISHGFGALFGIAATVLCVVVSVLHRDPWAVVSSAIYGATLILLFTMSTLYHALAPNRAKAVFRVLDHCSIFLLIAGTYTPYTLVSLRGPIGWVLFGFVWGGAILGITFNAINLEKARAASLVAYIAMGWAIVFAVVPLWQKMEGAGVWLLIGGGLLYTVGAIFYAVGHSKSYMHSVFHFFVLFGAVLHFFSIFFYVI